MFLKKSKIFASNKLTKYYIEKITLPDKINLLRIKIPNLHFETLFFIWFYTG